MPGLDVRRADPELLGAACALVDEVFAGSRGALTLAARFPHVLSDANAANLFVALAGREVLATVATRPLAWRTDAGHIGAIGLVATRVNYRGRGIATTVLEATLQGLAEEGAMAAVLWTTRPAIYERLGFRLEDPGVLGVLDGEARAPDAPQAESIRPAELEALRAEANVERSAEAWRAVPPPAREVVVYRTKLAYGLVGRAGAVSYVYELKGDSAHFPRLLSGICRDASTVYVNDRPGTRAYERLGAAGIRWEPKTLGMWLPLTGDGPTGRYVPYFDRI